MKTNKLILPIIIIFSSLAFSTEKMQLHNDISFDWYQLFRFFITSLKGFLVIQLPMLLILLSLWVWTLYMQVSSRVYPSATFIKKKLHSVQDTSDYIYWFGELGTFIGMFAAIIQLGNNGDKSNFAIALGMAIATSILGKMGQIVGRAPERRLSNALFDLDGTKIKTDVDNAK